MGSKWLNKPLGNLISYIGKGISPKYTESQKSGVMVLGQKCVRNWNIDYSQARFHDETAKAFNREKIVLKGDILINATGVGSAGRVAQVLNNPKRKTVTDGHVITLRASGIDPIYLGYFVKTKQSVIEQMAEGSTGQTEMNRRRLQEEIIVSFPDDTETQLSIARFASNLDRRIELNNQINDYLAA